MNTLPSMEEMESRYWLEHSPTIAEIRRLNRESLYIFPLGILDALLDCGINLDAVADAVVKMRPCEREGALDMRWFVEHEGKLLVELRGLDAEDGTPLPGKYRAVRHAKSLKPAKPVPGPEKKGGAA